MYNPEATQQLVSVVAPIMLCWFGTGFVIAVLYHLSLYYIEGEFTEKDDLLLDIFVSLIRFPFYLFAWPAVLFFDRTALHRIKLLWSYLEPKSR
ncbi:MAG: hypothetical protein ABIK44_03335 [candidate division WOR-3 bacterium]